MENVNSDWEEIQITLISKGSPSGSIRMEKKSIETLMELHGSTRGEILDMLFQTIIDERNSRIENNKN